LGNNPLLLHYPCTPATQDFHLVFTGWNLGHGFRFRVEGVRVEGWGFRVEGLGFGVQCLGFRV
jgi:hypothetical protein